MENDTDREGAKKKQARPGKPLDFWKSTQIAWVAKTRHGEEQPRIFLKMIHIAWVSEARLGQEKPRTFENDTHCVSVTCKTRRGETLDCLKMIQMAWVSEARHGQEKPHTFWK